MNEDALLLLNNFNLINLSISLKIFYLIIYNLLHMVLNFVSLSIKGCITFSIVLTIFLPK